MWSGCLAIPAGRIIELFNHLPESDVDLVRPRDEREASVMAEMMDD
jgi:acetolactate synthase-1/2/3 large subunit